MKIFFRIQDFFDKFVYSSLSTRSLFVLGFGAYLGVKYGLWTNLQFFVGLAIFFGILLLPSIIELLIVLVEWAMFGLFCPNPMKIMEKQVRKMNKSQAEFDSKIAQLELLKNQLEARNLLVKQS